MEKFLSPLSHYYKKLLITNNRIFFLKALASLFFILNLIGITHAAEKEDANASSSTYPREYFEQYNAQNAFEMIQRIPGFNLEGGGNARGFSGNAGNVLVDNVRPTTKSGGLESVLKRIPAGQVKFIELLRGGNDKGSETSGQSLVANIIREQGTSSGTWKVIIRRTPENRIRPDLTASYATQLGDWQTSSEMTLGNYPEDKTSFLQNFSSAQVLTSETSEKIKFSKDWARLTNESSLKTDEGLFVLNSRFEKEIEDENKHRTINNINDTDTTWLLTEREKKQLVELSLDWTQPINNWKWRLLTLGVVDKEKYSNQENSYALLKGKNTNLYSDAYQDDSTNTELIIRSTLGKVLDTKLKPEIGFEIASNRLDTKVNSFSNGIEEQLSNSDVVVSEIRAEIFVNSTYQVNKELSVDSNITAEFSKINVDGDNPREKNFNFIKSRVVANYQIDSNNIISFEIEKKVDQLDFNDFSSSAEAVDDRVTVGNSNLVPTQTNKTSLSYDWRFSDAGALKVELFYEWKKDVLEKIILPSGDQTLGNAGDAEFFGFDADLTLPLDLLLTNSNLILNYQYKDTSFYDEIINEYRSLNGIIPVKYSANFRQDITSLNLAWGVDYVNESYVDKFEVNEIERKDRKGKLSLYLESGFIEGIKTSFMVSKASTDKEIINRSFFIKHRRGARNGNEINYHQKNPVFELTLSGSF